MEIMVVIKKGEHKKEDNDDIITTTFIKFWGSKNRIATSDICQRTYVVIASSY